MKTRCRKCNDMFDSNGVLGANLCQECAEKENSKIANIQELIKLNPGICVNELSELTGLSKIKVMEYVRKINA